MTTQTINDVIERVRLVTRDLPQTSAALKFEIDTVVQLMEKEGDESTDGLATAALRVLAKNLNISSSWLIEGKPGRAAEELKASLSAKIVRRPGLVTIDEEVFDRFVERLERIPDAAAA